MNWISVKERLPDIPKGKYGVSVLVAVYDKCYAEISNGHGYDVYEANFSFVEKGKDAKDFMTLAIGTGGSSWHPIMDEVTHWMPMPEPPKRGE